LLEGQSVTFSLQTKEGESISIIAKVARPKSSAHSHH
jgi:hypothetical protein